MVAVGYTGGYTSLYSPAVSSTTIKVPSDLRDRINAAAAERGTTASGLIETLLENHLRQQRMAAFGRAIRGADEGYWEEFREWDTAGTADLDEH